MGCFPCRTLQPEVAHLNACYPPSKALLSSGPEYRPLSQDLSKLTYFATNKPSTLAKIGEELEKRVSKETSKATAGHAKYRASLLISLAVLRALLTECRGDLALFARPALKMVHKCLDVKVYQRGGVDLEVVSRAAAAFTAFTTYTDGSAIGVDDTLTKTYLDILGKFGKLAVFNGTSSMEGDSEKPDLEFQSRTRLVGLAALHGAASSDAIFSSTREFPRQLPLIISPIMVNIFEGNMSQLKLETARIDMDASPSPYFGEFSARAPLPNRRAPSLHIHIPGEKGPSSSDVLSANLRTLHALVQECNVTQASQVVDQSGLFLDSHRGWGDPERCCWLAERLTAWIALQYRFVVPTRVVEMLVDLTDAAPSPKHTSSLAMVTTILNSTTSLVGLGVSDLLQNLVSLIIRRIHFSRDANDPLLPPLVQCISSLGTHIYYADQISDLISELSNRISDISPADQARDHIVRVLVCCIRGVMVVVDQADEVVEGKLNGIASPAESATAPVGSGSDTPVVPTETAVSKGKSPAPPPDHTPLPTPSVDHPNSLAQHFAPTIRRTHSPSRRNPISPEVWQDTLPLLCEADYRVRSAYSRALILFLETELPSQEVSSEGQEKRPNSDLTVYRFCNALYAAIYTLLMSSCLGIGERGPATARDSPIGTPIDVEDSAERQGSFRGSSTTRGDKEKGVSFKFEDTDGTGDTFASNNTLSKKSTKNRRPSLPARPASQTQTLPSFSHVATPYDFSAALLIIDTLFSVAPAIALQAGVPMLLALDRDAGNELIRRSGDGRQGAWVTERKRGVMEFVGCVWRRIGERWGVTEVEELANKGIASLPLPHLIPAPPPPPPSNILLPPADVPIPFLAQTTAGESSTSSLPLLDPTVIVHALANSRRVQLTTGKDGEMLQQGLDREWSVEKAIRDSIERFSSVKIPMADEDDAHYKAASALLMNLNNASYHSVLGGQAANGNTNRNSKVIDVTDLRDALGGRTDTHSLSLSGSIASFQDHALERDSLHSIAHSQGGLHAQGRRGKDGDVKEVLKDIFRDKRKGKGHQIPGAVGGQKGVDGERNSNGLGMTGMSESGSGALVETAVAR